MSTIQWINLIITLICDLHFRLLAALFVAIVAALFGVTHSRKAAVITGGIGLVMTFGLLEWANYLLDIPLGPPLALPPDYTSFWLPVAVIFGLLYFVGQAPAWILLWLIWDRLAERNTPAMKRAPRVCSTPGCPELVSGHERYCARHRREHRAPDHRPSSSERGYDATWQKLRHVYLSMHPRCSEPGCMRPATDVDHIVPLRDGGTNDWQNLRVYCHSHHSKRTAKDQPGGFVARENVRDISG